jgi:hypothetical protein
MGIEAFFTDRQTDRQTTSPTPMRAGENFFLRKFSTIPLTTFARFARSLRSWNDKTYLYPM